METSTKQNIFSPFKIPLQCVREFTQSFWDYSLSAVSELSASVALLMTKSSRTLKSLKSGKLTRQKIQEIVVHAGQEVVARSKVYVRTREVNARLLVGIFLCGIVAPLSDVFYALPILQNFYAFNKATLIEGWYYDNYFYLFLCLGPYLDKCFTIWGAYYILVTHKSRRSYLFALPLGIAITKMIWLLFVTSHAEFHQIPTFAFWLYGFGMSFFLVFISDYLAWRKYHRADSFERRFGTITQAHELKLLPAEKIADQYAATYKEQQLKAY